MKTLILEKNNLPQLGLLLGTAFLTLLLSTSGNAFPSGRVTFNSDAPFAGSSGVHALTATSADGVLNVAGWADADATVPANLYQWWWLIGVDSGTGNGALIDGTECLTLQFDKGVGAAMIYFLYTGGSGG